jgi:uncharacterized phage protein (TIGR02220 family)
VARYRKIEVATWYDDRFQSLSHAEPSGQHLWLYLLSGPRTTSFPGLLVGREEVMAAELRWPIGPFRQAFAEASAKGLVKADWKAGLVVLRKALLDSTGEPRDTARPESPNVIKSWAKSWDEIPDCRLKGEYLLSLESFTKALGETYLGAFREGFRRALLRASTHPSLNQDQDQEQKQEQEEKNSATPTAGGTPNGFLNLENAIRRNLGDVGVRRGQGPKPKRTSDWTDAERASAKLILRKLGERNDIEYTGTDEHMRLIINQLRLGRTEMELRGIVGYCASEWADQEEMRKYLRPETLFGPKTISKYLDPSRAWVKSLPPDRHAPQPSPVADDNEKEVA